ncbi:MAG: hypothetical protein HY000_02000 [Planctomycetes bacterium]|nr:hypothetical protein [Planctomycetota bacterium]
MPRAGLILILAHFVCALGCGPNVPTVEADDVTYRAARFELVGCGAMGAAFILFGCWKALGSRKLCFEFWGYSAVGLLLLTVVVPSISGSSVTVSMQRVTISSGSWFPKRQQIDFANVDRLSYWLKVNYVRRSRSSTYLIFHKKDGTEEQFAYILAVREAAPLIVTRARQMGVAIVSPELQDMYAEVPLRAATAAAPNQEPSGDRPLASLARAPAYQTRSYRSPEEPILSPAGGDETRLAAAQPEEQPAANAAVERSEPPEEPMFDASGNRMGRVPASSLGSPLSSTADLVVGDQVHAQFQDQWWYATIVQVLPDSTVKIHFNDDTRSANDRVVRKSILRKP